MIEITLPDGSKRNYNKGVTALDVAKSISEGLARHVLAAEIDGQVQDPFRPINENSRLKLLTWNDIEGKSTFWHSTAHLMAEALEFLYPNIKLGIGPSIEQGFYYDIDFGTYKFTDKDIPALEEKMKSLAKQKSEYLRQEISKKDATQYFKEKGDQYKLELLEGLNDGEITFYKQGGFTDLCRGPHIPNTGFIKALKITSVAGAYWRGDEKNVMLTRLYGISFPKQKELTEYLELVELAKARDHRKLGKELELFTFSTKVGVGLPLWLPKGVELREKLENFLKKIQKKVGYQQVISPHIGHKELYKTSGHYAKYGEDSFQPIKTPNEDEEFLLKPMNCPHHCEMYKDKPRSYKELPIRFAEFGTVYRYEQSGELHGLTRVRGFTQDDAHIFCMSEQVKDEFKKVISLIMYVFDSLGFNDYSAQISLRDKNNKEKYIGDDENWDKAEQAIKEATEEMNMETSIVEGEAAFYGPKLDFMVRDALGRSWQLGTVQVDYNLPERFELEYTGSDNSKLRPVMIHRAPFGSMERFIAILIESTGGNFPLWLAPTQIIVLPLSDRFNKQGNELLKRLTVNGINGIVDERSEKISRKIRDAELNKIPYMLILGEKEIEKDSVSVRKHKVGDLGVVTVENFAKQFDEEIEKTFKPYQE